ncbi:uncharacterized protein LOC125240440 [Leguminivora glycinivorella]|uniref:uncharacterized protein LOC125240440 n=1 Tax=Leguminivora glycinivorella TaxID=1035111 RepID=UPI00200D4751|nr:uncharacterized protein LOC125240440 [Leguminivora glycinivorella]
MKAPPGFTTYQFALPDRPTRAAICIGNNFISTLGVTQFSNPNLCIVQLTEQSGKKMYLTSIYVEPINDANDTLKGLEAFLRETADSTHIIAGDFNGWHSLWNCPKNNARGNVVSDMVIINDLTVCNTGSNPTFEVITASGPRVSIIDLTLLKSQPPHGHRAIKVLDWKVDTNICPSSDHHAITFTVSTAPHKSALFKNKAKLSTFRYDTSRVNWEEMADEFKTKLSPVIPSVEHIMSCTEDQLDAEITHVTEGIIKICDELLPRSKGPPTRPPVICLLGK